ncbi:MAG: hypothetical protein AAF558_03290 [Verrucomicrobiota bacterium]
MKYGSILLTLVFVLGFSNFATQAKDKPWKEFEKAEDAYKDKSKEMEKLAASSDPEKAKAYSKLAENYDKMADIKKDAAKNAKRGKWDKIDWKEYEQIEKENAELMKSVSGKTADKVDKKCPVCDKAAKK